MTKPVVIYSTMMCPFCHRAKSLLESKSIAYREIDVGMDPKLRREMVDKANGGYTVPQIFIGDHHVGGCDDLYALERAGKLDGMLAS